MQDQPEILVYQDEEEIPEESRPNATPALSSAQHEELHQAVRDDMFDCDVLALEISQHISPKERRSRKNIPKQPSFQELHVQPIRFGKEHAMDVNILPQISPQASPQVSPQVSPPTKAAVKESHFTTISPEMGKSSRKLPKLIPLRMVAAEDSTPKRKEETGMEGSSLNLRESTSNHSLLNRLKIDSLSNLQSLSPKSGHPRNFTEGMLSYSKSCLSHTAAFRPRQSMQSISVRKQLGHINSHYTIEISDEQVGQVRGNFFGTVFNVYGGSEVLLATICYIPSVCCCGSPTRETEIYLLLPGADSSRIPEGANLKELYGQGDQPLSASILKLVNRKPKWNPSLDAYVLSFKGKSKIPSVKSAIFEEPNNPGLNKLMFCKVTSHSFFLEFAPPFTQLTAMGYVASSLDFKLAVE